MINIGWRLKMWPKFSMQSYGHCVISFPWLFIILCSLPVWSASSVQRRPIRSSRTTQNLRQSDTNLSLGSENAFSFPPMQRVLMSTTQQPFLLDLTSSPLTLLTPTQRLIRLKRRGGRLGGKGSHSGIGHGRTGARQDSRQSGAKNVFPRFFLVLLSFSFMLFTVFSTFSFVC